MEAAIPIAARQGMASCHTCGKVSPLSEQGGAGHSRCPRCGTPLHLRKPNSLQRTWALLIAAALLYIPANCLPIMVLSSVKGESTKTILSGVITFWDMKAYPVAIIIFTASVLIPLLKVAALVRLCLAAQGLVDTSPRSLGKIYLITELLGRWSMVDVFVVAIMACLVRLGALLTITPGPAALAFSAVVILTMFAAMSFDPRLIWDRHRLMQEAADGADGAGESAAAEARSSFPFAPGSPVSVAASPAPHSSDAPVL